MSTRSVKAHSDSRKFAANLHAAVAHCDQSYKASTIVNYDSRVVPELKIPHIMTLES